MTIKTVILDRDGVINIDSADFIKSPDEFIFIENSIQAINKLAQHNINLFISTNQSGISRKLFDLNIFFAINQKLNAGLNKNIIKAIFYCPHHPEFDIAVCTCRKPLAGMINKIKSIYNINLENTAVIGDSLRDLESAKAANCKYQFLVKTGNGLKTYNENLAIFNNTNSFSDLHTCVDYILQNYI